jgi:membrane associated rhomboid family serine protease
MATTLPSPHDPRRPRDPQRSDRESGLLLVVALAVVMWVVETIDVASGGDLERHGIQPHDTDGLVGIATAPFLHAGWAHLFGNTVPFLVLGAAIAWSGLRRIAWVTVIVAIVGGLGVWVFAPSGTNHIGASGVVFGYATYLISRGAFSRSAVHLGIGIIVLSLYGTTLLFGLEPRGGISWQGHLFGGIGGVLAAYWLDQRSTPARPARRIPDASS